MSDDIPEGERPRLTAVILADIYSRLSDRYAGQGNEYDAAWFARESRDAARKASRQPGLERGMAKRAQEAAKRVEHRVK